MNNKIKDKRNIIPDYNYEYSNRNINRKQAKIYSFFYIKYLHGNIEKIWWDCLEDQSKSNIIDALSGFDVMSNFFSFIKSNFEPNLVLYREEKLKKLGI